MSENDDKTIEVTLTKAEMDAMPPEELNAMFIHAFKVEGKAVVKDKDGNVKYDDPTLVGSYGEAEL